jgi:all-trans-8'-apo-beta-carotenal 15,15'-oxygenase
MKRRDFIQALSALASTGALPSFAAQTEGEAFDAAVADKPWLKAFKGVDDATQDLHCESLALSGRWPAELRGRFYRNGPGLFERGGQRYRHWFDGDGMVQQFTFTSRAVSHRGRLVRTPKLLAEQRAGRFLYSAFGTSVRSESPAQGPDSFNTANTNAIEHAGRVLAMWEGGSAFALDTKDLSTLGPVTWKDGLQQVPFSAHPKIDPANGHLWNIGTSGDRIIAWHVDAQGHLVDAQVGASPYPNGMVHDMAITARHLVVPLPPVKLDFSRVVAGDALEQAFTFQAQEPLRILVMSKDDITQRRVFELPAQFVFHVGNAYERADGNIALTFIGQKDHRFLIHGAPALMSGRHAASLASGTQSVVLDMRSGRASVEALGDTVEFPRIDPRRIGLPARHLLTASSWVSHPGREGSLFHGIQLRDLQSGKLQRHDYGAHMVVEEHIVVPKPGQRDELDAWLVGTTFDARRQITLVNVLDARRVIDGPIAQAALPYALPLGFHGNFTAA